MVSLYRRIRKKRRQYKKEEEKSSKKNCGAFSNTFNYNDGSFMEIISLSAKVEAQLSRVVGEILLLLPLLLLLPVIQLSLLSI